MMLKMPRAALRLPRDFISPAFASAILARPRRLSDRKYAAADI